MDPVPAVCGECSYYSVSGPRNLSWGRRSLTFWNSAAYTIWWRWLLSFKKFWLWEMQVNWCVLACCPLWMRLYMVLGAVAFSPDNCIYYAEAINTVSCTSANIRCKNWLVVVHCAFILHNEESACSFYATSWSIYAYILAVDNSIGTAVYFQVAHFVLCLDLLE